MSIVWNAAKLAESYMEANNIPSSFTSLVKRADKWYGYYPWLDTRSIAALVIENPNNFVFSDSEIRFFKSLYF